MATTTNEFTGLRKIERGDVRLLWYSDFWDVPINGLCLYRNRKCWFELAMDNIETGERTYLIRELSTQQLADEERWHALFREKVGTHTDFDEPNPQVMPQEQHHEFYEPFQKRPKPDYSGNQRIGWFEL